MRGATGYSSAYASGVYQASDNQVFTDVYSKHFEQVDAQRPPFIAA
jgi:hypothetical protein